MFKKSQKQNYTRSGDLKYHRYKQLLNSILHVWFVMPLILNFDNGISNLISSFLIGRLNKKA